MVDHHMDRVCRATVQRLLSLENSPFTREKIRNHMLQILMNDRHDLVQTPEDLVALWVEKVAEQPQVREAMEDALLEFLGDNLMEGVDVPYKGLPRIFHYLKSCCMNKILKKLESSGIDAFVIAEEILDEGN